MGSGTIVSGGTNGSYQIKLDYGKATKTARLASINARLAELVGLLATALEDLNFAEYDEAQAIVAVEAATDAYVIAAKLGAKQLEAAAKVHSEALAALVEKKRKTAPLRLAWQALKSEDTQQRKEKAKWEAVVAEETVQAWCADLTEDATGPVATLEIPGEGKVVLIAPAAPAPTAEDGALTTREVQSPAQVFFNAAILPGWQKFSPTYRRGTVTAVNYTADTVDVLLEATDKSSAQKLVINPTPTLSAVPVQYMTCNTAAFEPGDRCVVRFIDRDWTKPRVVGFVDNPKTCEIVPDVHLVFWDSSLVTSPINIVRNAGLGGVNTHGSINTTDTYRTIGINVVSNKVKPGIALTDAGNVGGVQTAYSISAFYDNKPVLMRNVVSSTYSATIGPAAFPVGGYLEDETQIQTTDTERIVTFGATVLATGTFHEVTTQTVQIFQPPYSIEPNFPGATMTIRNVATFSTWPGTILKQEDNTFPGGAIFFGVRKLVGPWASWSVFITNRSTGTEEIWKPTPEADYEVIQALPPQEFVKISLGPPAQQAAAKPLAVLASIPPRENLLTYRDYTTAGIPPALPGKPEVTPLDRHLLDFGYVAQRIDGIQVKIVAKNLAYCWPQAASSLLRDDVTVTVVNYKTGDVNSFPSTDIGIALTPPPGRMPRYTTFTDRHVIRCENDPDGPYFWIWVYSTDLTLVKTITNKPGDLGPSVVQVATPTLTGNCYMIGAMRDEVTCM